MSTDENRFVDANKRADILQRTFQQYYGMAVDHHTKAGTISSILLGIVGAITVLVGIDQEVCGGVDAASGIFVMALGLFGAAWVWKQQAKYHYWAFLAEKYQDKLIEIWPEIDEDHKVDPNSGAHEPKDNGATWLSRDDLKKDAHAAAVDYGTWPSDDNSIRVFSWLTSGIADRSDRWLWVLLHFLVAAGGFFLAVFALACQT